MSNSEDLLLSTLFGVLCTLMAIVNFRAATRLDPTHRLHREWRIPLLIGVLLTAGGLFGLISGAILAAESIFTQQPTIMLFPVALVCGSSTIIVGLLALQLWHQFQKPAAPLFDEEIQPDLIATTNTLRRLSYWMKKPLQTCIILLLLHIGLVGIIITADILLFTQERIPLQLSVASVLCHVIISQGLALCVAAQLALYPDDTDSSIRRLAVKRLLHGFAALMALLGSMTLLWIFPLLIVLIVFYIAISSRQRKQVDKLTALWILTNVVQSGRPPETELKRQLESTYSRVRILLEQVALRLSAGESWNRALCITGIAPQSIWMEVCTTADTQQFPEMLLTAARRETDRFTRQGDSLRVRLAFGYFRVTIILLLVVLNFIGYFLIPKFRKILEDFHQPVDATVQTIFSILTSADFVLVSLVLGLILLAPLILTEVGVERALWQQFIDRIPFIRRRNRLTPDLLRALHWAVRDNVPLEVALEEAAEAPLGFDARSRLHQAAAAIREGRDPWESLQHTQWLTRDQVQLLQSAHAARNLPWALTTLSESISAHRDYRRQWWLQILHPCLIMLLAIVVGLAGYAIFGALTQMTGQNA